MGLLGEFKVAQAFAHLPVRNLAEGITDELLAELDQLDHEQETGLWGMPGNGGDPHPMLAAALGYAKQRGWKSFPARMEDGKKWSWLSAKHAPGGENWGMTNDPEQLRRNFTNLKWRLKCGVGVPTGWVNQIFDIEGDTKEGHGVDGLAALQELEAKHGKLPDTLMAESPTGSLHRIYNHPGSGIKVINRSLPGYPGVDIKGDGGMFVAPPSVRGDGAYRWLNDNPIADAPRWLVDLVTSRSNGKGADDGTQQASRLEVSPAFAHLDPNKNVAEGIEYPTADIEEIRSAANAIPPSVITDESDWMDFARALAWQAKRHSEHKEALWEILDATSRRAPKYDETKNRDRFERYIGEAGTGAKTITIATLFHLARKHGWEGWDGPVPEQEPLAAEPLVVPRDLWAIFDAPPLPTGLLPEAIEKFTFAQAKLMGCDPAGIAMGALTVCAAAIPDEIKLQVKQHDPRWRESTRLWTGLVGPPSTMKSPIMLRVIEPLKRIDNRALARYMEAMAAYEKLPAEQRSEKPKLSRIILGDTTPEAAQLVLQDNANGVLLFRDELSGWFGSMDKYSGHRGAASDRGFWLSSFNGGQYFVDRVTRRSGGIPNLSVSILGGIQVEPLRALVAEGVDDGLIQRIFPIMLRPAVLGKDEPLPADQYDSLVERLNEIPGHVWGFSAAAQQVRRKLEQKHLDLMAYESVNRKLAAHIGKYNGLFARLCLLWHCIENVNTTGTTFSSYIDANTAQRVADFMHGFLLPHAVSFYVGVVGLADDHDRLANVASYILAHKLERITPRDIARGDRSMRKLDRQDTDSILHRLDALGWVSKVQGRRFHDVQWVVNPEVHRLFEERAKAEADRRQREREAIAMGYEGTQGRSS